MSVLELREEGGIAWLTMNRPERLNAMNPELVQALRAYFEGLNARSSARVVVLQGAGRAFCAGLDLKDQVGGPEKPSVPEVLDQQKSIRDIMLAMRRCPQPIVSVVQGSASGGGFALALASDVRLATPDARMNAAFIRIGLSACDVGVSYFLPRMVGSSVAAEYLLTGRFMDAQRAYALGLVSRVAPLAELQAEAQALAEDMLHATPLALRLTKDALNFAIDARGLLTLFPGIALAEQGAGCKAHVRSKALALQARATPQTAPCSANPAGRPATAGHSALRSLRVLQHARRHAP